MDSRAGSVGLEVGIEVGIEVEGIVTRHVMIRYRHVYEAATAMFLSFTSP